MPPTTIGTFPLCKNTLGGHVVCLRSSPLKLPATDTNIGRDLCCLEVSSMLLKHSIAYLEDVNGCRTSTLKEVSG